MNKNNSHVLDNLNCLTNPDEILKLLWEERKKNRGPARKVFEHCSSPINRNPIKFPAIFQQKQISKENGMSVQENRRSERKMSKSSIRRSKRIQNLLDKFENTENHYKFHPGASSTPQRESETSSHDVLMTLAVTSIDVTLKNTEEANKETVEKPPEPISTANQGNCDDLEENLISSDTASFINKSVEHTKTNTVIEKQNKKENTKNVHHRFKEGEKSFQNSRSNKKEKLNKTNKGKMSNTSNKQTQELNSEDNQIQQQNSNTECNESDPLEFLFPQIQKKNSTEIEAREQTDKLVSEQNKRTDNKKKKGKNSRSLKQKQDNLKRIVATNVSERTDGKPNIEGLRRSSRIRHPLRAYWVNDQPDIYSTEIYKNYIRTITGKMDVDKLKFKIQKK